MTSLDSGPATTQSTDSQFRTIDVAFAIQLIVKVGLMLCAGAVVPVLVLWVVSSRFAADNYYDIFSNLSALHVKLIWVSVLSGAGQMALAGLMLAGIGLFASHRIAGPLIRLEHGLRALAAGDLTSPLRFRKGDQDQSLRAAYEFLRGEIQRRVAVAEECARALETLVTDLPGSSPRTADRAGDSASAMEIVREQSNRLRRAAALDREHDAR